MEIILARSAGFCFGVKRATQMAFEAAEHHSKICSLGPIIHSPQLVDKLAGKGVSVIRQVEEIPEGAVIIRSHGVTATELDSIQERQLSIIDATCPFVKKAQEHVALLHREGYTIVLLGDKDHPEVQGLVSYAEGEVFVVATRGEAERVPRRGRMGVLAQTTQSQENLRAVVDACLGRCKELRVFNTICDATMVRQEEARTVARQSDLVLVVGGYNSANTTRLARICREIQPHTRHVETAAQIDPAWLPGVEKVGITAGASTPCWIIDEVVEKLAGRANNPK